VGAPKHWNIPEFLEYLDSFIDHYDFGKHLHMNAKVDSIVGIVVAFPVCVRKGVPRPPKQLIVCV
jgi:hypothetical protein